MILDFLFFRMPSYRRFRIIGVLGRFDGFVFCLCDLEAAAIGKLDAHTVERFAAFVKKKTGFETVEVHSGSQDSSSKGRLLIGKRSPDPRLDESLEPLIGRERREFELKNAVLEATLKAVDNDIPLRGQAAANERIRWFFDSFARAFALGELPRYARFADYSRTAIVTLLLTVCNDDQTFESLLGSDPKGRLHSDNDLDQLHVVEALRRPEVYWKKRAGEAGFNFTLYYSIRGDRYPLQFRALWVIAAAGIAAASMLPIIVGRSPSVAGAVAAAAILSVCPSVLITRRAKPCRCETVDEAKSSAWNMGLTLFGMGWRYRVRMRERTQEA